MEMGTKVDPCWILEQGGATGAIDRGLAGAAYRSVGKGRRFIVKGKYGPLRDGEIELARRWGAELAEMLESDRSANADAAHVEYGGRTDERPRR